MGESKNTSTLPLALEGHQWFTSSHQINSGKEPRYPFIKSGVGPGAIQDYFGEEKNSCPYQDSNHGPSNQWNRRYSDQATQFPKFQPTTGHEGLVLAALPPGMEHCTHCTGGWVGTKASLTAAQNLVSTPGFNPQTAQPIASHYTHAMKANGEKRHNSTLTSELDGRQWLILRPRHYNPRMEPRYSLNGKLDGAQVLSGLVQKI